MSKNKEESRDKQLGRANSPNFLHGGIYPVQELQKLQNSLVDNLDNLLESQRNKFVLTNPMGQGSCQSNTSVGNDAQTSLSSVSENVGKAVYRNDNDTSVESDDESDDCSEEWVPLHKHHHLSCDRLKSNMGKTDSSKVTSDTTQSSICYKCDFCSEQSESFAEIKTHLTVAKHFSTSSFKAEPGNPMKLIEPLEMLKHKEKSVSLNILVVLCPFCFDLFEDIYMCGYHCVSKHNDLPYYSIMPVFDRNVVQVNAGCPQCDSCKMTFQSNKEVHAHMKSTDHLPYTINTDQILISECPYCNELFYNNFICSRIHVMKHKIDICELTLTIVRKPSEGDFQCIQFEPTIERNGVFFWKSISEEMKILRNTIHFLKRLQGSNEKRSKLQKRLNVLRKNTKQV